MRSDDSRSLKLMPAAVKHAVSPAVSTTDAPVCWLPSNRVTLNPAAIRIDEASLSMPPRLTRSAVLMLPAAVKPATQPPKLQCWNTCTIGVPPPPPLVHAPRLVHGIPLPGPPLCVV